MNIALIQKAQVGFEPQTPGLRGTHANAIYLGKGIFPMYSIRYIIYCTTALYSTATHPFIFYF